MAAEGFSFLLDFDPSTTWGDWLENVATIREASNIPVDRVPAAFLAADVDGDVVGRVSVRFELNEFLAREGGHIGYAVLAPYRRRGYATAMLDQALVVAHGRGLDRVLIVCDAVNVASAAVIKRCGGALERVVTDAAVPYSRYWIDTEHASRRREPPG